MRGRQLGTSACVLMLAFGLSACSGGGGGVTPVSTPINSTPTPTPSPTPTPTPSPTPTPTVNYDTLEYRNSNYAVDANAIAAYNAGATGQGVKIGIVDSGVNPSLPEFTGRIDPASGDVVGSRGISDDDGHGTAVSAVAAAGRNDQNTMGVAFNATIVSERADSPNTCSQKDGCQFSDTAVAAGIDAARIAGAKIINLSLGGTTPGTTLLNSMQKAVSAGIVLVISAGNDSTANPDPFALTPAQNFPGSVIIAGSIGADDGSGGTDISQISTFTDKAGTGAQYYLAALGYKDRAPDNTGAQFIWTGTSFSAPTIAGAVALMSQAFPNLTGKQIVSILFQTADDLGTPGVDSTFGNGRLNIQRAFAPIGPTSLAGTQTPLTQSSLPGAAGDASAAGQKVGAIILDGYDRAYVMNLASTLQRAAVDHPLSRALQGDVKVSDGNVGPLSIAMTVTQRHDLIDGYSIDRIGIGPEDLRRSRLIAGSAVARLSDKTAIAFGFAEGAKAMERRLTGANAGSFLIARDVAGTPGFDARRTSSFAARQELGGIGITASGETGNVWQEIRTSATGSPYRLATVALDKRLGSSWLSLGYSLLDEKQTLLGGRMSPLLGGGGARTSFIDAETQHDFGDGWTADVTARRGWTDFSGGRFESGAYAADLTKLGILSSHDSLGVRIAQPLRVERGGFALLLPTSWDYVTAKATDSLTRMSLRPSGREVDGELSYGSTLLGGRGWLGANLFYRREPGHIASLPDDRGAALRFSLGF